MCSPVILPLYSNIVSFGVPYFFAANVCRLLVLFSFFSELWKSEKAMKVVWVVCYPQTEMQRSFMPPGGDKHHQNVYTTLHMSTF